MNRLLSITLASIPFICFPGFGDGIRAPKETLSILALVTIVGMSLFENRKPRIFLPLFALFGWGVLVTCLPTITLPIFMGNICLQMPGNLIAFKSLFYIGLSISAIFFISSMELDLKKIAKVISWVTLILSAYGLIQLMGLDEFFRVADPNTGWVGLSIWDGQLDRAGSLSHRIVGTLGNPSIFAIFLAFLLPFSLYVKNKITVVLSLIIIALTFSSTAIVASLISIGSYYILRHGLIRKPIVATALVVLCLILCFSYQHLVKTGFFNSTGRTEMMKASFEYLRQKPMTGCGLGSFEYLIGMNQPVVNKLSNNNWREMHCEYGQWAFEAGIVGLILLGWILWSMVELYTPSPETALLASSLLALAFCCITYFCFRVSPISYYGVAIVGMYLNKTGEKK